MSSSTGRARSLTRERSVIDVGVACAGTGHAQAGSAQGEDEDSHRLL